MNFKSLCDYPYFATRRAVLGTRGTIATRQPLEATAGMQMLLEGGNAVDAAVAAAIALTAIEPTSNGIGSDAFAIAGDGETPRTHANRGEFGRLSPLLPL